MDRIGVPDGVRVVVLGPPGVELVRALWAAGLRPVRAQVVGSVWVLPAAGRWS